MRRRGRVPGCIFINNGRYWWRIRLPGETKKKARPLVPDGASYATNDPGVAEQVARDMYARAVFAAVMALAILGFAAVGTLFAAAVSSTRLQGGLLAMLIFPVTLPLVIASTKMLVAMFRDGEPLGGLGLGVLIAFDAVFLVVSWLVFESVLEP